MPLNRNNREFQKIPCYFPCSQGIRDRQAVRVGNSGPLPAGVGPVFLGVTAVLAVTLIAANREVIDIMETITYRFRNKSLDEDLYREAVTYVPPLFDWFIPTPDPPPIKKFQDMR